MTYRPDARVLIFHLALLAGGGDFDKRSLVGCFRSLEDGHSKETVEQNTAKGQSPATAGGSE